MDCINAQWPWAKGWEDMKEGVGNAWDATEDVKDGLEQGWSSFKQTAKVYNPTNSITSINKAVKGEVKKAIEKLADSKAVEDIASAFDPDNYDKHGKSVLSGLK